jgi:hypothetical protein
MWGRELPESKRECIPRKEIRAARDAAADIKIVTVIAQ